MSKLTTHDYLAIAYYLGILGVSVFMLYGGLIGAIKPLIAEIIWLFAWSMLFAYEVSLIGVAWDRAKTIICPYCGQWLPVYGDATNDFRQPQEQEK